MTYTSVRDAVSAVVAGLAILTIGACSDAQPAASSDQPQLSDALAFRHEDPTISISNLADGDVVTSPLRVDVVTDGVTLVPAGSTRDGHGHWHLLIDRGCQGPGEPIPSDSTSHSVDTGADSLTVELPPGQHELCAQLGDGFHVAVDITDTIVIDVVD